MKIFSKGEPSTGDSQPRTFYSAESTSSQPKTSTNAPQRNRWGNRNRKGNVANSNNANPQNKNPNNSKGGNWKNKKNNNNRRGGNNFSNPQGRNVLNNARGNTMNTVFFTSSASSWSSSKDYNFSNVATQQSKLKIIPVGGVEEVGVNCTVFQYEDDIIVVDAGLGFDSAYNYPGIDGLVPNLEAFYDKKDKIRGLVITHGHTDHIGAIHHIIDKLGFPTIYAPRLAAGLIREKLKETSFASAIKIVEVDGDSSYYLGKFHLTHFKMTHSIPDNYGISINTPVGRIVTPSDYKLDNSPYKESTSDYSRLAKLGDEGVLVLLSESTYAKTRGWAPSESVIAEDIEDVIRDTKGRLIIGMFSTMVNRMRQVVEIAEKYGKKVAVLGRSVENQIKISHGLGYIDVLNSTFVPFDQIQNIPEDKLVILTTGSQGEENAALMRMAKGEHQKISLKPTDTIVFSSSRIPGNEGKIDKLINMLTERGVKIITNDYMSLHTTGHGHQEDMKLLLRLLKPKFLLPIHGEASMLVAHKQLANEMGYADQDIIITQNGSVVEVSPTGWAITEKLNCQPLWVEQDRIGDFDPQIVKDRMLLTDEGVIVVALTGVESNFTADKLSITHRGFFVQTSDEFLNKNLVQIIIEAVNSSPDKSKEVIKQTVLRQVENALQRQYEKKAMVIVTVL